MDLDLVQHKLLRIRIQDPKKFVTDTDPDQILYESWSIHKLYGSGSMKNRIEYHEDVKILI